jgi:hypothetical protein
VRLRPTMNIEPRDLTYEERATWGECPVCHAKDGEWCNGIVGLSYATGVPVEHGVHLGRLRAAPFRIRIVPV